MANTSVVSIEEQKTDNGIFCRKTFSETSKEPLVLVMGYGGSLRHWPQSFVERLAQTHTVFTYDNRGTGLSIVPKNPQDYTIKLMAGDLEEVAQSFGLTEFHMLGYSMGSCIALQYAYDRPSRIKSLFVLSGTAGGAFYSKPDPAVSAALANPAGQTLWDLYNSMWKLMYSPERMEQCKSQLKAIFDYSKDAPTPLSALAGHSHAFRGFDGSQFLQHLKMPVTVLTGEDDRLMPPKNSTNIAENVPNARLVILPDCEHCPHVQDEDLVVNEIERATGVIR